MAGYPEAHPDVISDDPEKMKEAYWSDIQYLKQKVRSTPARTKLDQEAASGCEGLQRSLQSIQNKYNLTFYQFCTKELK